MIIVAALSVASVSNITTTGFKSVLVVLGVIMGVAVFKIHPILVFILAGLIGVLFFK